MCVSDFFELNCTSQTRGPQTTTTTTTAHRDFFDYCALLILLLTYLLTYLQQNNESFVLFSVMFTILQNATELLIRHSHELLLSALFVSVSALDKHLRSFWAS